MLGFWGVEASLINDTLDAWSLYPKTSKHPGFFKWGDECRAYCKVVFPTSYEWIYILYIYPLEMAESKWVTQGYFTPINGVISPYF